MKGKLYRKVIIILLVSINFFAISCKTIKGIQTESKPISHQIWDELLQKHVDESGFVDYKGFVLDSNQLNNYLLLVAANYPNENTWTREEILAYWINAYNAYTVQLIIRNYPLNSIKDIKQGLAFVNSVWDIKFIIIENQQLDLNNIEHNILRKMEEPRIHFAVNCASYSCPKLLNNAYTANKIDAQLQQQTIDFINDKKRNNITTDTAKLSSIFNWFTGDFTKEGSLKEFINQFSIVKMNNTIKIEYIDYNWNLNEQ